MITKTPQNTDFGEILPLLNDVYATKDGVLLNDGTWKDIDLDSSLNSLDTEKLLEQCQEYHPGIYQQHGYSYLCLPRLDFSDESFAVVDLTSFEEVDQSRICKIATQMHSSASSSLVNNSVFQELSHLMEESSWLRNVSSFISLCSADTEVKQITCEMLPRLREIIEAESIGFMPASENTDLDPHWYGPDRSDLAQQILKHHKGWIGKEPIVANYADQHGLPCSYIAVRMVSGDEYFGNLFAINKKEQSLANKTLTNVTGELEFGTNEAGLLEAVASLIGTQAHNHSLYSAKKRLFYGTVQAMTRAVDARDPYTRGHSDRVAYYSRLIANAYGLGEDECEKIYLTGQLHDIGKIGIPDEILNKTGKLTDAEYEAIKLHPSIGYRILEEIDELDYVLPGVLHHHERADGKGYPYGLTGHEMSLDAQIISVSDAFDAMTSSRSYRPSMSVSKAKEIIETSAGTQFTETAVKGFLAAWDLIEAHALSDTSRTQNHPLATS